MIAVIDTNHLLRIAAAYQRSPLFAAWRNGRFEIAISQTILAELERVRHRPKVRRFMPPENLTILISFLQTEAIFVTPAITFPHCRDPKDDMIIATAIAARADYIVTTDRDLLDDVDLRIRLRNEWSLRVVNPAEFLAALS